MTKLTRQAALAMLVTAGGLLGLGYVLHSIVGAPRLNPLPDGVARADGPGMMANRAWT